MGGSGASDKGGFQTLQWYILVATPMAEQAVARRLKRRMGGVLDEGFGDVVSERVATFVAVARWMQRANGKSVRRERIVFPRYIFAGFVGVPDWMTLREIEGLQGVLSQDGSPYQVKPELVGTVILRCETGFYRPAPEPMVQRGMRVVARCGQFRGCEGDVTAIDRRRGLADVVMDMFDGARLTLRLDDLVSRSYADVRMTGS